MPSVRLHLAQARGEVRGGVLLSSAHMRERAYPAASCRSADIKQARPAYPFCTFLSPFPTGKGLGDRFAVPFLQKAQGKRGTAEKVKILVFTGFAGTGRKCAVPFFKAQTEMGLEMGIRRIQ